MGFAFTLPAIITSIRDLYSEGREATGQGVRVAVSDVSKAVFPILASVLVVTAWQLPFLLYALALPISVALFFWFDEPAASREGPFQASDDHETTGASGRQRFHYVKGVLGLVVRRHIGAIPCGRMLMTFAFLTYVSLLVVQVLDGSPGQAAILVALYSTVHTVTATQVGLRQSLGVCDAIGSGERGSWRRPTSARRRPRNTRRCSRDGQHRGGMGIAGSLYRSLISGFAPQQLRGVLVGVVESVGRLGGGALSPAAMRLAIAHVVPDLGTQTALQLVTSGPGLIAGIACIGYVIVNHLSA